PAEPALTAARPVVAEEDATVVAPTDAPLEPRPEAVEAEPPAARHGPTITPRPPAEAHGLRPEQHVLRQVAEVVAWVAAGSEAEESVSAPVEAALPAPRRGERHAAPARAVEARPA